MKEKIYLPGLNGLRAIAALSVMLSHTLGKLEYYKLQNQVFFSSFAKYGVTIFFTLSGFLITYLLIKELNSINSINVKKFYLRRILRIWPLYFLGIFLVLLIENFKVETSILYYVFILPNIPYAIIFTGGTISYSHLLVHYWSLGVEEQFYAFWPFIIKYSKKLITSLIIFCVLYFVLKIALKAFQVSNFWLALIYNTQFSCLGLGAIGAYLFDKKKEYLVVFNKKIIEVLAWLLLLLIMLNIFRFFSIIEHEIISVLTVIIIFNQVNNTKPLISLENKIFDYLGKISFGLYIYNPLVIYLLSIVFLQLDIKINYILKMGLIVVLNFTIIIFISHISYYFFEKRFLKMKNKYTTIESFSSNPNNHK